MISSLKKHFEQCEPLEGCGVLVENFNFIPCKNILKEKNVFCICPEEYWKIKTTNKITGIVHSHVNISNRPSEDDVNHCNITQIPYYIYSYPTMKLNILVPKLTIGVRSEKKNYT